MATNSLAKSLMYKNSGIKGKSDFDILGQNEFNAYTGLGESQAADIGQYATDYEGTLAKRRSGLEKSLSDYAAGIFNQQNPAILEDLNRRGLFTSPTAVAGAQSSALKDIALDTSRQLLDFDTQGYNKLDEYGEQGLGARLGGQTTGLESALEMDRSKLERRFGEEDSAAEADLAKSLAQISADAQRKAAKSQMWGSIIGGGASGLGAAVGAFCFDPDTMIDMEDGSKKPIKEICIGELTRGGTVYSVRQAITSGDRFEYKGVIVTGGHAVYDGCKWVRVKDLQDAKPLDGGSLVYCIATNKHRIYSNGVTFADEYETDNGPEIGWEKSLAILNAEESKNGDPS